MPVALMRCEGAASCREPFERSQFDQIRYEGSFSRGGNLKEPREADMIYDCIGAILNCVSIIGQRMGKEFLLFTYTASWLWLTRAWSVRRAFSLLGLGRDSTVWETLERTSALYTILRICFGWGRCFDMAGRRGGRKKGFRLLENKWRIGS